MSYNSATQKQRVRCDAFNDKDVNYRNELYLYPPQTIVIYCIIPFATICIIFNIYFFCQYPKARQPPFDILLFLTFFSILTTGVYLSTNIYNEIYPIVPTSQEIPDSFNNFCQTTGVIHFISQFGSTVYNAVFCFYYTCKIKNPLKSLTNQNKQIHILCFLIIIIAAVSLQVSDQIGISALGICGLKFTKIPATIQLSLFALYFIILLTSSIIFLRALRKISRRDPRLKMFFKYFLVYTILLTMLYFVRSLINTLLIGYCSFQSFDQNAIYALSMIGNITSLIRPGMVTVIIFFHPQFSKNIMIQISEYFAGRKVQPVLMRRTFMDKLVDGNNQSNIDQFDGIELPEMKQNEEGYLSTYKQMGKLTLLSTILGCISLMSHERNDKKKFINEQGRKSHTQQLLNSWNFYDQYKIAIDEQIIKESKNHFIQQVLKDKLIFIAYSINIFEQLILRDKINFIQQSVNPYSNVQQIKQNAKIDGGKSGQFFLYTYDNKIILKTITQQQLNVLLDKLPQYYNYLKNNPQSLIVKIYGVFSVINQQTKEKYHFMMMTNLSQDINKKYILRAYDCKGSTHQRQVFKQDQQHTQTQYSKKTMKDVDFQRLQNKIWINKQIANSLKNKLKRDSQFFCTNGLIDYSLIIIKVDYNAYCLELNGEKPIFNPHTMFRSEKEQNVIYILGIIDYLQTWNAKKRGQRFWKSIFIKKKTISSQKPSYYSKRFCQNLIDKIFE